MDRCTERHPDRQTGKGILGMTYWQHEVQIISRMREGGRILRKRRERKTEGEKHAKTQAKTLRGFFTLTLHIRRYGEEKCVCARKKGKENARDRP